MKKDNSHYRWQKHNETDIHIKRTHRREKKEGKQKREGGETE